MKLSIFTTLTSPDERGDNASGALRCYMELADELVVVNGGQAPNDFDMGFENVKIINHSWPREFSWKFIGQQFQRGYEAATGDWVVHCDLDMIFHERDSGKIRQALRDYPHAPAVSFYKWQFIQPDRYNLKSRLILAVNKAKFGERITFSGSGDLCQPQLDGKDIDLNEIPQAGVPFYNYDFLCKSIEQVTDDVSRMDRAYQRHFGRWLYSTDGTEASAYEGWLRMVVGRNNKPSKYIPIEAHPKYVQETIRNLKPTQSGYSLFGNADVCSYYKDGKIIKEGGHSAQGFVRR